MIKNDQDGIQSSPSWYVIRGCVVVVVTTGIIISNIINLVVWKRNKRMPTATRLFLINLSISDLMVGVFATSLAIYPAFVGEWPYGDVMCQISGLVHGMSVTLSIWSIAMVGIDRYFAAARPYDYKTLMSRKRSLTIVACMWLAAFITFIAPIFTKKDFIYYEYKNSDAFCGLHWEYPLYCIITAAYIPVASAAILVFTSIKIHRNLLANRKASKQQQHQQQQDTNSIDNGKNNKQVTYSDKQAKKIATINQRALLILITASVMFLVFWGPYVLLHLSISFRPTLDVSKAIKFVVIWIANANSMVNVVVYSLTNKSFQDEARELLLRLSLSDNLNSAHRKDGTAVPGIPIVTLPERDQSHQEVMGDETAGDVINTGGKTTQEHVNEKQVVSLNDISTVLNSTVDGEEPENLVEIHLRL